MKISLIIPIFNNAESIKILFERVVQAFNSNLDLDYEVILINDGSFDNSLQIISESLDIFNNSKTSVKVIEFTRNFGQLAAIIAGFENTSGDAVICISADLQDPPELIQQMIQEYKKGSKVVICKRSKRKDKFINILTSKVAYYYVKKWVRDFPSGGFDIFLLDKDFIVWILNSKSRFRYLPAEIINLERNFTTIEYKREKRIYGKSGYTFNKRWEVFVTAMLDSNYYLIQIFTKIGIVSSILGFVLMLSALYGYLIKNTPFSGFTAIICSVLLIGGLNLVLISILGEYTWRIYDMNRSKPLYIIREII